MLPKTPLETPRASALSVLDATTANFALTNAIWLFEKPKSHGTDAPNGFELSSHLRESLRSTLSAYPQWCGKLKSVTTVDGTVGEEAQHLPAHARRFGRIYAHYGTPQDPGVELVTASSSAILDELYPALRTKDHPIWNLQQVSLSDFIPPTSIATPLVPDKPDQEAGVGKALMAIQITTLACGGFIISAKIIHPLADISALVAFVKDWARVSRCILVGEPEPKLSPTFEPWRLDDQATGDINADTPEEPIIEKAKALPLHRYDWWAPAASSPFPAKVPEVFQNEALTPAGNPMPWSEWDVKAPVSNYIIHFNREQIELLYASAAAGISERISRHDAVLAHIWSCIMRARNLHEDEGPVHCDLVYGLRPALKLGEAFMGSPIMMINIEMSGRDMAATSSKKTSEEKGSEAVALGVIARKARQAISKVSDPTDLGAHIYSVMFEKSPQRLWQAFMGQRHMLVTTWARAGLYEIDFGLGSAIRYADGVVPLLDGNVLIKEAPPSQETSSSRSWTENGVDVSVNIRQEDMERLIRDPLLFPS